MKWSSFAVLFFVASSGTGFCQSASRTQHIAEVSACTLLVSPSAYLHQKVRVSLTIDFDLWAGDCTGRVKLSGVFTDSDRIAPNLRRKLPNTKSVQEYFRLRNETVIEHRGTNVPLHPAPKYRSLNVTVVGCVYGVDEVFPDGVGRPPDDPNDRRPYILIIHDIEQVSAGATN